MTATEKFLAITISTVAFLMMIATLVIVSTTAIQVNSLQSVHQHTPRFTRDRHGNLEIELPEDFDEPPVPKYRNPLGSNTGNTGNTGNKDFDKAEDK